MRTYVLVTGIVFALLTLAHLWRFVVEPHQLHEPWFIVVTVLSASLAAWALHVLRRRT